MSEQEAPQPPEDGSDAAGPEAASGAEPEVGEPEVGETGNPAVDEVLRSLRDLSDRPVDEHVEVFERAHETLRRTLNDAGQQD